MNLSNKIRFWAFILNNHNYLIYEILEPISEHIKYSLELQEKYGPNMVKEGTRKEKLEEQEKSGASKRLGDAMVKAHKLFISWEQIFK